MCYCIRRFLPSWVRGLVAAASLAGEVPESPIIETEFGVQFDTAASERLTSFQAAKRLIDEWLV